MKKLAITLLALVTVSLAVTAQEKQGRHAHKRQMLKQLNLSPEQKEKAKTIKQDFKGKMEALKKNDGITVREYRLKRDALVREHKTKMKGLLTPEQQNRLTAARDKMKAERKMEKEKKMEMLSSQLSLTPAQQEKMKTAREAVKNKMAELKNNETLTREQKREMIKELRKKNKESFMATLTEEQKKILDERKKNRRHRRIAK
jgi:Spy/CpxP family protein refolding chaperone